MLGTEATRGNLINSLYLNFDEMEAHLNHMEAKYHRAEELETRAEEWQTEDAEIVLVGYGIVARILKAGGIASLAHPVRVKDDVAALMPELCDAGLNAIEAYHSDHGAEDTELYLGLAKRYGLMVTGGSDFHGAPKPEVMLGTGCAGNLHLPGDLLEKLREGKPHASLT